MHKLALIAAWILLPTFSSFSQGAFNFSSFDARTHVGSLDGPLAGSGIWAQMLAGSGLDSLVTVGLPAEHFDIAGVPTGIVFGGFVTVPGIDPGETAYVKMLAWDGNRWGTVFSMVPADQFGMTDIVPVVLEDPNFGTLPPTPHFTQPAIVPIPEPGILALCLSGGFGLCVLRRARHL